MGMTKHTKEKYSTEDKRLSRYMRRHSKIWSLQSVVEEGAVGRAVALERAESKFPQDMPFHERERELDRIAKREDEKLFARVNKRTAPKKVRK
jgi:hypothetical protein